MAEADLALFETGVGEKLVHIAPDTDLSSLKATVANVFGKPSNAEFQLYLHGTNTACTLSVTLHGKFDVKWTQNDFRGNNNDLIEGLRSVMHDTVAQPIMDALHAMSDSLGGKMDALGGKMDALGGKMDALGGKMDSMSDTLGKKMSHVQNAVEAMQKRLAEISPSKAGSVKSDGMSEG